MTMQFLDAEAVHGALDYPRLIEALRTMFRDGCSMPRRHHHTLGEVNGHDATLLLMPAWSAGRQLGVKLVNVFPGNATLGKPAVSGVYLLMDGATGEPRAVLDGTALTLRRTAAASALAATYLARADSRRLLVVGTGNLAPHLARAHATVRDYAQIEVWGRRPERAEATAAALRDSGLPARAVDDLAVACARADVVSCATLSQAPLIDGTWLSPGSHLDLVGGFTPQMREADDTCIERAEVYVDTRDGACHEAGDIVVPLQSGLLVAADIRADLFDLVRGERPGRTHDEAITLFKSVGVALEDLAAAQLVVATAGVR